MPEAEPLEGDVEIPSALPVLPLKETVVFPQSMTPLAIGQERSVKLIDDVVAGDRMLALVTTRESEVEQAGFDDIYEIGTAGLVHRMIRVPDGTLRILVQGLARIRLERRVTDDPYPVGEFVQLPDVVKESKEVEALTRTVQNQFARVVELVPTLPDELQLAAANIDDPSILTYLVASTLRLKTEEKQQLLELVDVEQRLRATAAILSRELEVFELGSKIQSQVESEMEKTQREYFLRQQMKAIQDELGESDPEQAELEELRTQIDAANLPEEAQKAANRELSRLEKLPSAAAEYGVIRSYLDWILAVPWNEKTEDNLDLEQARKVLDADHYDLDKIKERILESLAVGKLKRRRLRTDPLLRRPARRRQDVAWPLDRDRARAQVRAHLGGRRPRRVGDPRPPAHVHRRDARNDHPGAPRRRVAQPGVHDRRDRQDGRRLAWRPGQRDAGGARSGAEHDIPRPLPRPAVRPLEGAVRLHGEPARDDPGAAARPNGRDPALGLHRGREARRSRKRYLVPKQLEAHGLDPAKIAVATSALRMIIREYTREAGVRSLERRIADALPQGSAQGR